MLRFERNCTCRSQITQHDKGSKYNKVTLIDQNLFIMRSRDQRARKVDAKTLTSRWSYLAKDLRQKQNMIMNWGLGHNTSWVRVGVGIRVRDQYTRGFY